MAELPILHSQRPVYDWVARLDRLRTSYLESCAAEPSRVASDAAWLDASLVFHALKLKGVDVDFDAVLELRAEGTARGEAGDASGALAAVARVREAARACEPLTAATIVELNALVDRRGGGRLRETPPVAAYRGHTAPGPDVLPVLLENAADWFTADSFTSDFHPVEQAALALIRICDLQPFPSNNELTARIASSHFTLRKDWPPIVVHHELEAEYRTAILHAMHMDTQPIVDLLAKCVELTYVDLTAAR